MVELIDIFLQRKKMEQLVAEKPGLGKVIVAWIIVTVIYSILAFFWGFIAAVVAALFGFGDLGAAIGVNLLGGLISLILIPVGIILGLIVALISDAIVFLFAKLLGGKGYGFFNYFSVSLYVSAAVTLFMAIIYPLLLIPFLNIVVILGILIYCLYLTTILIKAYFELSTIKAVLAWLIPAIVLLIIAIILVILLIVIIGASFAALLSSASTSGLASLPFS